jgi:hypothetical protein
MAVTGSVRAQRPKAMSAQHVVDFDLRQHIREKPSNHRQRRSTLRRDPPSGVHEHGGERTEPRIGIWLLGAGTARSDIAHRTSLEIGVANSA